MKLSELTRELFDYLVAFRQKVDQGSAPGADQVRGDLEKIFDKMEEETRRNPALISSFSKVKYALASLTDEVLLSSTWEDARVWEVELLEQKYFGSNIAGNKFFELIELVDDFTPDVAEIYYLCLVHGFSGYFLGDDARLAQVKASLLERMGSSEAEEQDIISPEAYTTSAGGATQLPRLWKWRYTLYIGLAVIIAFFVVERYLLWPAFTSPVSDAASYAETVLDSERATNAAETGKDPSAGTLKNADDGSEPAVKSPGADPPANDSKDDGDLDQPATQPEPAEEPEELEEVESPGDKTTTSSGAAFPSRKGVVILAGMFRNSGFATERFSNLRSQGYPAMVVERKRKGTSWHYVLTGIYDTRAEAKLDMRSLKKTESYSLALRSAKKLSGTCLSGCQTVTACK